MLFCLAERHNLGPAPRWYLRLLEAFTAALEDSGHLVLRDHKLFKEAPKDGWETIYLDNPSLSARTFMFHCNALMFSGAKLLSYFRRHQEYLVSEDKASYRNVPRGGFLGRLIASNLPFSPEANKRNEIVSASRIPLRPMQGRPAELAKRR